MTNPVSLFEIASNNLNRSKEFYATVFQSDLQDLDMPEMKLCMFPGDPAGAGSAGALVQSGQAKPSSEGTIIYFECDDIDEITKRVESAGGTLLFPKTPVGDFGFISQFLDPDGNRIGLHSHR